jgi:hypothetical protein
MASIISIQSLFNPLHTVELTSENSLYGVAPGGPSHVAPGGMSSDFANLQLNT